MFPGKVLDPALSLSLFYLSNDFQVTYYHTLLRQEGLTLIRIALIQLSSLGPLTFSDVLCLPSTISLISAK